MIGIKSLKNMFENKEVKEIDFLLEIDSAANLIEFGLDPKEGIAVIETIQSCKRNRVIIVRFNKIDKETMKVYKIFETSKRH